MKASNYLFFLEVEFSGSVIVVDAPLVFLSSLNRMLN